MMLILAPESLVIQITISKYASANITNGHSLKIRQPTLNNKPNYPPRLSSQSFGLNCSLHI